MSLDPGSIWPLMKRLWAEIARDRIGLISAGIAFYGLLSLFPGLAALMALGGLLTRPAVLVEQLRQIGSVLPPEAARIILDQAAEIAGSRSGGLGLAAVVGIVLSIWSASKGVGALIAGLHVAAGRADSRGLVQALIFTLGMTAVAIGLLILAILSTVVLPAVLAALNVGPGLSWLLGLVRWPLMGALAALGLGLFYRLSIADRRPPPRWITPGAVLGAVLWLAASVAFSVYVQNFADYNKTFGTLGGVVSLLMWLWLSAYVVLVGEELNALLADQDRAA